MLRLHFVVALSFAAQLASLPATAGDHLPEAEGCNIDPTRPDSVAFSVRMWDRNWLGGIDEARFSSVGYPGTPSARFWFDHLPAGWTAEPASENGGWLLRGPMFEGVSEAFVIRTTAMQLPLRGQYFLRGSEQYRFPKTLTCTAASSAVTPASPVSFGRLKVHYR